MAAEPPVHDLFVSYATEDAAWVEGYLLPGLGLPPERVHTHRDFEPGRPLVDEYARAVEHSHHTLLILSPAFVADKWARLVKDLATYLNVKSEQGTLFPLRYKPAELGLELRSLISLDFTDQESGTDCLPIPGPAAVRRAGSPAVLRAGGRRWRSHRAVEQASLPDGTILASGSPDGTVQL
jgi:hypothetical protein